MIQRIQSLLLLGVVILLTTNLFVPIWTGVVKVEPVQLTAFSIIVNSTVVKSVYYVGGLIIACIALATVVIFLYNNRPLQIKLCYLLFILNLGIIGTYFIAIPAAKDFVIERNYGEYEIGYFLPIIANILIVAAKYYIKKDEELVKSVDRLR